MTNREWLNGLDDEEFAKAISDECEETGAMGNCPKYTTCGDCVLSWLKKERKQNDD